MDGVEEEQRAHAFVQVVAGAAEAVQRLALGEQRLERQVAADGVQRAVALLAARRDHGDEQAHWRVPPAAGAQFAVGEEFENLGEHLRAILPVEGEGQLGDQQTVGRAEIVAAALVFEREVLLVPRQVGERGGKRGRAFLKKLHHRGGQHVDAEEAEVVAGANAGHHEALLGFGGRGLLDDGIDAVEIAAARNAPAGDGAEVRQQTLAGGLHAGDGALRGFGERHQAVRGGLRIPRKRRGGRPPCEGRDRRR